MLDNTKTTHGSTHPYSPLFEATPFRRWGNVLINRNCNFEIQQTRTKILPYQHIPTSAWASRSTTGGSSSLLAGQRVKPEWSEVEIKSVGATKEYQTRKPWTYSPHPCPSPGRRNTRR